MSCRSWGWGWGGDPEKACCKVLQSTVVVGSRCSGAPLSLQHMREAAERRQQLELEHEQALAFLNAKQQEIQLLQQVSPGVHVCMSLCVCVCVCVCLCVSVYLCAC